MHCWKKLAPRCRMAPSLDTRSKLPNTNAIPIHWLRRSPAPLGKVAWGKIDGSNRSSRGSGEVAAGCEGDLRKAWAEYFSRRNGGAGAGAAGDGAGGGKPVGTDRGNVGKFDDRE